MMHFASDLLKRRANITTGGEYSIPDSNEINIHKNEFTHMFLVDGYEINSLREIPSDTKYIVCCMNKNFKGIFDSERIVTYHGAKVVKNNNMKNCLFNKTYQWVRDKMIYWTEANDKVEGQNKILDMHKHI